MSDVSPERAAQLRGEEHAARRAARPAWRNGHFDRLWREREARRIARAAREAARAAKAAEREQQRKEREAKAARITASRADKAAELENKRAAKAVEAEAERERAAARRRYNVEYRQGVRKRPLSAEKQREVNDEVDHLTSLLLGTHPTERISDQQAWDAATSKLRRLWLQSGDKVCTSCGETVPPSRIRPPGPANAHPGRCNRCAEKEYAAQHLRVFGRPYEGPRPIPMKDGASITIAELARRHRERERAYRLARIGA